MRTIKLSLSTRQLSLVILGVVIVMIIIVPFYQDRIALITDSNDADLKASTALLERLEREMSLQKEFLHDSMRLKMRPDGAASWNSVLDESSPKLHNSSIDTMKKDLSRLNITVKGTHTDSLNSSRPVHNLNYEKFLSQPILNPFQTTYKINPDRTHCAKDTYLLIAVPSSPTNFALRMYVRSSERAIYAKNPQNRAKLLFFIGSPDPSLGPIKMRSIQNDINNEDSLYEDIVQATFFDTLKNGTKKAAFLFQWASTFCKDAKFLLRYDDDIRIELQPILESLEHKSLTFGHFMLGRLMARQLPKANPREKYYVPESQWPVNRFYPPYLLRGAYGFPMRTAPLLLESMRRTQFLWLEDVFVTGLCSDRVGVPSLHHEAFLFGYIK